MLVISGKTCVHQLTPAFRAAVVTDVPCGLPTFVKYAHGWLCLKHFRQQQENEPAKPRLPQPVWKGYKPVHQSDDVIVRDIIATDTARIAEGPVVVIRCGILDPVYLRICA